MFVTGPDVIKKRPRHEEVTKQELGGAMTHTRRAAWRILFPRRCRLLAMVRELLGFPAFEQPGRVLRAVRQTIRRPPRGIL